MGSHTLQQLRGYSFDEIKELFETTMKRVNTFVPMETEVRGRTSKLAAGSSQATITDSAEVRSSKRAAEAELGHEGSKRQKTIEASGSVQEQPDEEEKKLSQEDLQQMMMVVPVEEVYVEALQIKYPIIDWEVYIEESRKYWKIIKVRIMQISQEIGQNWTNTDTKTDRVHKSREFDSKKGQKVNPWSTMVN
ncbi:hypothetical protein Tco_0159832, partial [Tanacetum coccineum]